MHSHLHRVLEMGPRAPFATTHPGIESQQSTSKIQLVWLLTFPNAWIHSVSRISNPASLIRRYSDARESTLDSKIATACSNQRRSAELHALSETDNHGLDGVKFGTNDLGSCCKVVQGPIARIVLPMLMHTVPTYFLAKRRHCSRTCSDC